MIPARRVRSASLGAPACLFVGLAVAAVVGSPASALAQMGQPPSLPMAVDLRKVAVGAWAEYNMSVGQMPAMKSRMALVAKTATTNTLELTMEGGMFAMAGGKLVMHTEIDANQDKENPVKRVLMQIGDNTPMEMPLDSQKQGQFHKPNPKSLLKEETIKVAAGTFKAKHYRDKLPNGAPFDFWVSAEVPPFGLVKVDAEPPHGAGAGAPPAGGQGPVKLELTARGKDAKMAVTGTPTPFNQTTMMAQLMGGAQGGGGMKPLALPPPSSPPAKK